MIVQNLNNMLIAKEHFGITANSHFTFILGGLNESDKTTSSCEKFEININKWMRIKNLNFA